jgi:hypothetical protein
MKDRALEGKKIALKIVQNSIKNCLGTSDPQILKLEARLIREIVELEKHTKGNIK